MTRRTTETSERHAEQDRSIKTARHVAYDVLTAWQQRGAYAGRVLDELCRQYGVFGVDRAFALDLAYTTIRRQATIDALLAAFVDRPRRDVEDGLWRLLQIGVCQLVLLDGVPEHAALHETGELAKQLQCPQWTALVNGVLRSVAGALDSDQMPQSTRTRIPLRSGTFRHVGRDVLIDPEKHPAEHLAKAYSYPRWLMRDWLSRFDMVETTRLCQWFNTPAPLSIRVNWLHQDPSAVQEALQAAGVTTTTGRFSESLLASSSFRPTDVSGFQEGTFSIQDESAMSAARLLAPQPGERILDLCAAPGGKTTHLAELMQNDGQVVAADIATDRLELVNQSAQRLGLTCIETQLITPNGEDVSSGPFDAVLVDVPCSNTGVLGKRPEARWRVTPESIVELVPIQTRLLDQAVDHVVPGGRIVYSTCSIDPRENRAVVEAILSKRPDVSVEQETIHTPGQPADGGYQALLRRAPEDL